MAYRNLDEFLTRLELAGDVVHLPVDRDGTNYPDVAEVSVDKVHVYTHAEGIRIVRNLFGTHQRVEQVLRVTSLDLIADRLEQLLEIGKPGALGAMVTRAMTMFSAIRTTTNRRAPSEFQKLSYEAWHESLPAVLTRAQSHSIRATLLTGGESPRMSAVSLRLTETGISVESWPSLEVGETVALVIGSDPAFMFAAQAPLPDIIHRSYFASWLRDKPLDMMHLPGLDIEIPSNAEAVIAANVTEQLGEIRIPGVHSIWTKPNPIYPQLLQTEHNQLRDAFVEIMMPVFRRFLPGLRNMRLRNRLAILTIDLLNTDRETILRQLWAIPISVGISYWLLLAESEDIESAVAQLTVEKISTVAKLTWDDTSHGVLLDASCKPTKIPARLTDANLEIEHLIWGIQNEWRPRLTSGES